MRNFSVLALITFLILSCSGNQGKKVTSIEGKVLSGNVGEVKIENIVDNPIKLSGETYVAEVDSNGRFSIEIPVDRLGKGQIKAGRFFHKIALMPGDELSVTIDADTIDYTGNGAAKNNFLYQTEVRGLWSRSFYNELIKGELNPAAFLESMTDFNNRRLAFLASYADSAKIHPTFVDDYTTETQVIFEDLIQQYPRRYAYKKKVPRDSLDLPEEYSQITRFSNYVDDSKILNANYLHSLRNRLYAKARDVAGIDTSLTMEDALYAVLFDTLSGKTREYVLTKWITSKFSQDQYDTIAIEKFREIEKDELAQQTFNSALKKFEEKRSLIGQPLPAEISNTLLKDTGNVQLTFGEMMDQYKGKVVYLDLWSMGCGPCRVSMPHAKKLREKLQDQPIEFVYATVDDLSRYNWDQIFEVSLTDHNHYVLEKGFNSRLHNFMEINWVPCYMIFDKNGHLTDFNADRPTRHVAKQETSLEKTLKKLAMR